MPAEITGLSFVPGETAGLLVPDRITGLLCSWPGKVFIWSCLLQSLHQASGINR